MPTGATTSTDSAMRSTRRVTAAAGEEHPRAEEGLARARAVQRHATRGGAVDDFPELGSFYVATEAPPIGHMHAHAVVRVNSLQRRRRRWVRIRGGGVWEKEEEEGAGGG